MPSDVVASGPKQHRSLRTWDSLDSVISEPLADGRVLLASHSLSATTGGEWVCFVEDDEDNTAMAESANECLRELFAADGTTFTPDVISNLADRLEARREEATSVVDPMNEAVVEIQVVREDESD